MIDEIMWRKISRDTHVNDPQLGPWEHAGVDDNIIYDFLKKRFIKELNMMIAFELIVSITCFVGVIETLMLGDDILVTILIAIICAYSNGCLYRNIQDKSSIYDTIRSRDYQVCDCEAFDIDITKNAKYCYVKDLNGQTLLEQKNEDTPVPMRLTYYGYFTDKEYDARLLRMKGLHGKMHYFVFPLYYLKNNK